MWEELIEFHGHSHAILLDAHANRTPRAFCRQGHFDPDFQAALQWKFGAIGDEKQNRLVSERDDGAVIIFCVDRSTRRRRSPVGAPASRIVCVDSPRDFEPPGSWSQVI
jgi:hypothetical protein